MILSTLDLGLLQAGAGIKGEFENRLKSVIDEVQASPKPIILFIDEAHTLIGAGGSAGQGDAANLLKPALARGDLRTVAATTWAEYKKYFEKRRRPDAPLPGGEGRRAVGAGGDRHAARPGADAGKASQRAHPATKRVIDAVRLSARYIPARQLPDKAVSAARYRLRPRRDEPAARFPPAIEDLQRADRARSTRDMRILEREQAAGASTDPTSRR